MPLHVHMGPCLPRGPPFSPLLRTGSIISSVIPTPVYVDMCCYSHRLLCTLAILPSLGLKGKYTTRLPFPILS